jgi:DNA mismatch endonuclease, patch repair protein
MSKIRGKNTKPEKYIRGLLYHAGFRYRINYKLLSGTPDIFLGKYKTVLFINGCFWHRHKDCRYATTPKSNTEFWENKFKRNVARDQGVYEKLKEEGFKVLVVWECTINQMIKDIAFEVEIMEALMKEIRKESIEFTEY